MPKGHAAAAAAQARVPASLWLGLWSRHLHLGTPRASFRLPVGWRLPPRGLCPFKRENEHNQEVCERGAGSEPSSACPRGAGEETLCCSPPSSCGGTAPPARPASGSLGP